MNAIAAPYGLALGALGGWAMLMSVLAFLSISGTPRDRTPSGHPVRDYGDPYYRRGRAHLNAVESAGPFLAACLAAVLVGAPAFWVNALACLFLVARIAMAVVHVRTENQLMRSMCYAVGVVCVLGLAVLAILGALAA